MAIFNSYFDITRGYSFFIVHSEMPKTLHENFTKVCFRWFNPYKMFDIPFGYLLHSYGSHDVNCGRVEWNIWSESARSSGAWTVKTIFKVVPPVINRLHKSPLTMDILPKKHNY